MSPRRPCCQGSYEAEHRDGCRVGVTLQELRLMQHGLRDGRGPLEAYVRQVIDATELLLWRHRPIQDEPDRLPLCSYCRHVWPCDDVVGVLDVYAPQLDKEPAP